MFCLKQGHRVKFRGWALEGTSKCKYENQSLLTVERAAMQEDIQNKRNVTAKDAIRILHENGVEISENEAEKLLDLMYFFGKLTVNQYIKDKSKIDIHQ